jgi:hypothetical protein
LSKTVPLGNTAGQVLTGEERRRSQRVVIRVPVTLKMMVAGKPVVASAFTASVNDHGAMLVCSRSFSADTVIELQNDRTGEKMNCRVTRAPMENAGGYLIPVEFSAPSPAFWRISFPPRDWKPGDQ